MARRLGRTPKPPKVGGFKGREGQQIHGTQANYSGGCRCYDCTNAKRIGMQDYRERRRLAGGSTRKPSPHGTDSCYAGGCRRASCVAAHSRSQKEYRSRKKARMIAGMDVVA